MTDPAPTPAPAPAPIDWQNLFAIIDSINQIKTAFAPQPPATPATPATTAVLSPIDKALGGQPLVGFKTAIAIVSYGAMAIAQGLGALGTATGDKATTTGTVLTSLVTAFGGLGITAKFDRALQNLGIIAAKPPAPPAAGAGQ